MSSCDKTVLFIFFFYTKAGDKRKLFKQTIKIEPINLTFYKQGGKLAM